MRAIAVDDEIYMLEALQEAVTASDDIKSVESFSTCSKVLEYIKGNQVDIAFLDVNMRGIGGLGLAEKILEEQPECKIIFCTGYEKYAVDAFRLHASGYLMKPITVQDVQKEIDHIKGLRNNKKLLEIKCFGNFEVLFDGVSLPFKRKKTKELFALLVDRNGSGMTVKEMCAILFNDDSNDTKNSAYLRQLLLDLKNTLNQIGALKVLRHETIYYRIDTKLVDCDYFNYLNTGKPKFYGEYMSQYSWAELTCSLLHFNNV